MRQPTAAARLPAVDVLPFSRGPDFVVEGVLPISPF